MADEKDKKAEELIDEDIYDDDGIDEYLVDEDDADPDDEDSDDDEVNENIDIEEKWKQEQLEYSFEQVKNEMDAIDSLIGAENFKALAREMVSIVAFNVFYTTDVMFYRNYVFSIDEGCGFKTCVTLFRNLLDKLLNEPIKISHSTINKDKFSFNHRSGKSGFYIECVDIREMIGDTNQTGFHKAIQKLCSDNTKTIYIFRVPSLEDDLLEKICDDISNILYVEPVKFEPLTFENMRTYATNMVRQLGGFTFLPEAYDAFDKAMIEEKVDGRFYGYKTVLKVAQEIVFRQFVRGGQEKERCPVISASDIEEMLRGKEVLTSQDMLKSLYGMEEVEKQLVDVVEHIDNLNKMGAEMPCIHMRFVGSPGTGKTTIARILGKMLAERGVLKKGAFYEYMGRNLVGKFIGHTEEKVKEICMTAYGSVLFIDEAYALNARSGDGDKRDFGNQAIEVLITEMENHRSDMVVIMAGYTEDMDELMEMNPGLESRMPYEIVFDNFTRDELCHIYMKMVGENYEAGSGLEEAVRTFIYSLPDSFINDKQFGNARYVRNLFERTQKYAINRCVRNGISGIVFDKEDFENASKEKGFAPDGEDESSEKMSRVGF